MNLKEEEQGVVKCVYQGIFAASIMQGLRAKFGFDWSNCYMNGDKVYVLIEKDKIDDAFVDDLLREINKFVAVRKQMQVKHMVAEMVRKSVKKAVNEAEAPQKTDKYGNQIPRFGQGWGKDSALMNRQGYNQDGTKGPWFSRSVACATAVLLNENGSWFVLAGQRGSGTPDYQGYWNLPCGYLDYNEDTQEAAMREVYEETGIRLSPNELKYFGNSSSPEENRQNVCFYYVALINGDRAKLGFSKDNMEENEVDGIQWLPLEKAGTLKWAFGHDELIQKIVAKYAHKIKGQENFGSNRAKIKKAIEVLESNGDTEYVIELLKSII